jgi:hypothetical protein
MQPVLDTALRDVSEWCALQEREMASRTVGTDCSTEAMVSATKRVSQVLFMLANLLEAGM